MSKRLQVLLPDSEMDQLRQIASRHNLPLGVWVREALRTVCRDEPTTDAAIKLRAIRKAAEYSFPTQDIREMNAEIEKGYQGRQR